MRTATPRVPPGSSTRFRVNWDTFIVFIPHARGAGEITPIGRLDAALNRGQVSGLLDQVIRVRCLRKTVASPPSERLQASGTSVSQECGSRLRWNAPNG
jgi:hypothetical protein